MGKYPVFLANHHASAFFCDTLKVILTGSVGPHDLAEMMELDLEVAHKEVELPAEAIQTVGDAMPGFGIVAAVLGIIITMGKIGGEAADIGESVGASLVGTFLGILLAYGILAPIAQGHDPAPGERGPVHELHPLRPVLLRARRVADHLRRVRPAQHRDGGPPRLRRDGAGGEGVSAKGQPIIIKKVKKGGHGGHHGGSWKVAYADFVTAMMAFFMVMWIMGMSEETRKGIASYFNDPTNFMEGQPKSRAILALSAAAAGKKHTAATDKDTDAAAEQQALERTAQKIKKELAEKGLDDLGKEVKVTVTPEGLQIELVEARGAVFFESGSATIRPAARAIVARLAPILRKSGKPMEIQGHTDAAPCDGPGGNFGLSSSRALSLMQALRAGGCPEGQFKGVNGYGPTKLERPDKPLDFSNRRVTILIPREVHDGSLPPAADLKDRLREAGRSSPRSSPFRRPDPAGDRGRAGPRDQQAPLPQHARAVRHRSRRRCGATARSRVRPVAERAVEVPLGEAARGAARRFLQAGLRRVGMEDDPRSLEHGGPGLRHARTTRNLGYTFQKRLAARDERAAEGLDGLRRAQPGRLLPPHLRRARRLEGAARRS